MDEHDQIYGDDRARHLRDLLRTIAARIAELDAENRLLAAAPELIRLMGDARTELFHYEVRSTYDTPEVAESRRIVEEAKRDEPIIDEPEDDEPWRQRPEE